MQYASAGGILPEDGASDSVRAPWEGSTRYDLRARENNIGLKPFKYASLMEGVTTALERMLHPSLPLALVIRQSDPEWRGHEGGAPRPCLTSPATCYSILLELLQFVACHDAMTMGTLISCMFSSYCDDNQAVSC